MDTPGSSDSEFASNGEISPSEPSTPTAPFEPFEPRYKVKVTEPIKDGEVVHYTIKTTLTIDGEECSVVRQFDDFDWLHHCMMTLDSMEGIIVPPLPARPVVEARNAEARSKKQLGTSSKVLIGDEFYKDCRSLEKYLKLMIGHNFFGTSCILRKFLLEKEAPVRAKIKKGIFGKIYTAVEESRRANHRDIDDYFQKERDYANEHASVMKEFANNFSKVIYAQQRISGAYAHLSTTLNMGGGFPDEPSLVAFNKLLVKFSEALDDSKHGCDVDIANSENTLGSHADLYHRYAEALKEMLYRRTCLLVEYEEANRALDKAKPPKKQTAEESKVLAERAFEECSEVAHREIQNYHRQRVIAFQNAMIVHSEAKIKTARDTYALLAKSLTPFKQMQN